MGVDFEVEIIDIVRDLNKVVSMLCNRHKSDPVANAFVELCKEVSDDLDSLEKRVEEMQDGR